MEILNFDRNYQSPKNLIGPIGDVAIWKLFGMAVLFGAAGWNLVSLDADKEKVALDAQVYLKLLMVAGSGLYGGIGFLTDERVRRVALSFPLVYIPMIGCLYLISSILSFSAASALASTISIFCIYLMTVTAVVELGKQSAVKILFLAMSAFVVGSWLVYFAAPEIGIMEEPITEGEFTVRMSGLAHPNTLGQHAAFCVICGVALFAHYGQRKLWILLFVVLAAGALVGSLSRASIAATLVSLAVGFRHRIIKDEHKKHFTLVAILAGIMLVLVSTQVDIMAAIESKMGAVSKSGDSDEITSATGRADIWAKSIQLIKYQPIFGYGPTTSKYLLSEYSMYTHNLLLNIGLSCGVFGLIIALVKCLTRIRMLFSHRNMVADSLVAFVLINGLFENVIFSNLCGCPTIFWILGLGWFQFDNNSVDGT